MSAVRRDAHWALTDLLRRLEATNLRLRFARVRHRREILEQQLRKLVGARLTRRDGATNRCRRILTQLSPLAVLSRGYAIVSNAQNQIIRSAGETIAWRTVSRAAAFRQHRRQSYAASQRMTPNEARNPQSACSAEDSIRQRASPSQAGGLCHVFACLSTMDSGIVSDCTPPRVSRRTRRSGTQDRSPSTCKPSADPR